MVDDIMRGGYKKNKGTDMKDEQLEIKLEFGTMDHGLKMYM